MASTSSTSEIATSETNTCMELVVYSPPLSTRFTHISSQDKHADGSTGVPLTTFTCFPELPAELRVKIWKYTFPGPRVIQVRRHKTPNGWKLLARAEVPIALSVNAESRTEALKIYTHCFAYRHGGCNEPANTPFDLDNDILTFDIWYYFKSIENGVPVRHMSTEEYPTQWMAEEDTERVKLLLLPIDILCNDPYVLRFNNLEILRVSKDDVSEVTENDQQYMEWAKQSWDEHAATVRNDAGAQFNRINLASIRKPAAFDLVSICWCYDPEAKSIASTRDSS